MKKNKKIISTLVAVIIIVILILFITDKNGSVKITTKNSLVKVLEISEIQSTQYIYNGVTAVKDNDKDAYYVNYEGIVTIGIDINKIDYKEYPEENKVVVTLPKLKVLDCSIDDSSLDFIFNDKSYNNEKVHVMASNAAKKDLLEKTEKNKELLENASKNTKSIVKSIIQPLIDARGVKYDIEFKEGDE